VPRNTNKRVVASRKFAQFPIVFLWGTGMDRGPQFNSWLWAIQLNERQVEPVRVGAGRIASA